LDGSKTAETAVEPAAELAKALGEELLFFVTIDPAVTDQMRPFADVEHLDLIQAVETYTDRVRRPLSVKCDSETTYGESPAVAILEAIERRHPRMVVMATHGRTGFNRWWLGSVTEKVVQASPIPVLVVPARNAV
jgi:nucleotide-binding universal stress UspA family protein